MGVLGAMGLTDGTVSGLRLAPVMRGETVELVDDVLDGDVGEGRGREGARDEVEGVHCAPGRAKEGSCGDGAVEGARSRRRAMV